MISLSGIIIFAVQHTTGIVLTAFLAWYKGRDWKEGALLGLIPCCIGFSIELLCLPGGTRRM